MNWCCLRFENKRRLSIDVTYESLPIYGYARFHFRNKVDGLFPGYYVGRIMTSNANNGIFLLIVEEVDMDGKVVAKFGYQHRVWFLSINEYNRDIDSTILLNPHIPYSCG